MISTNRSKAEEQLLRLKKKKEEAKIRKANLEGQLDYSYKRLKSKFGFTDIGVAEKALQKMIIQENRLISEFQTKMEEVSSAFEW